MRDLTVKEASEKWGISQRRICILCTQGRIPGAVKRSKVWMIPENAKKPEDGRRSEKSVQVEPLLLLQNATYCENRSHCLAVERRICEIQLLYLQGKLQEAYDEALSFVTNCSDDRYLVAGYFLLLLLVTDLGMKEERELYSKKMRALFETSDQYRTEEKLLRAYQKDVSKGNVFEEFREDELGEEYVPLISMIAAKQRLNHLIRSRQYEDVTNLEVISYFLEKQNCPEIEAYHHLYLSVYYFVTGVTKRYMHHMQKALDICLPRKWYTPIAEKATIMNLDFLQKQDKEVYNEIMRLGNTIAWNYVKLGIYKELETIPNMSFAMDMRVGFQIAQGKSNTEIAEYLGISQYKLKQYIDDLYAIFGAGSRRDIAESIIGIIRL